MSSTPSPTSSTARRPRGPARRPPAERGPRRHRDRHRPRRPADARARRDRRERRPAPHRRRPRLRPGLAVVGPQRLHPRLRRPAAPRRPARRRPSAGSGSSRSGSPSSPSPPSSAAWRRRPASWSPPARPRASAPRWPHPASLALLTTSAPDEAARNRALALFGAVSSGGASIGLLLGGLLTDVGSWRWTLFINVPIGIAVLVLARRFVDETPRRPGRFDIVGAVTATARRGLDRLDADRRPGARLDLGSHHRRLRLRRGPARRPRRDRASGRAPDDPAAPAAQPATGRRPRHDGPGRRRPAVDVLPGRAVPPARARLRPDVVGLRVPAVQPGHLRDVAVHAGARRPVRHPAADDHRRDRAGGQLRWRSAPSAPATRTSAPSSPRCWSTASRPGWSSCR